MGRGSVLLPAGAVLVAIVAVAAPCRAREGGGTQPPAAVAVSPAVAEPPVVEPPVVAPVATTPAASPGVAAPRPVRFFASLGYDHGLNDLLEVEYEGGGSETLTLNGGFTVGVGAAFLPLQAGRFETRATIGLKYDSITAENGTVRYLAFPLELTEAVNVRPLRFSLGASLLLAPSVEGDEFLAAVDLQLKSSVGLLGQVEWVLPFKVGGGSISMGLRYTWQKLEPEQGGGAEDASAVGGVVGLTL